MGIITNCYNNATILFSTAISDGNYIGGICGTGGAVDCYNTGDISVFSTYLSPSDTRYISHVGGISGHGGVLNCHNTASVSVTFDSNCSVGVGGINGHDGFSKISNCYNLGNVSGSNTSGSTDVGGICGMGIKDSISNCYNYGDVSSTSNREAYAGGIGGSNGITPLYSCFISNCYNKGNVSSTSNGEAYTGGICGWNNQYISNCYNTGNVSSTNYAGGICGISKHEERHTPSTINCFSANADVMGARYQTARIGVNNNSTFSSCYALSSMQVNGSAPENNGNVVHGQDAEFSSFTDQSWIEQNLSWDFQDIWIMSDVNDPFLQGLPVLRINNNTSVHVPLADKSPAIFVYPNPVCSGETVYITGVQGQAVVSLVSLNGSVLRSETFEPVSGEIALSIGEIPAGVYFIRLSTGEEVKMVKAIVK